MALSQDEQRMLAEIEKRLMADDPGLASCLTTFRRPGPGAVLRSPRARIIGSLFTVLLVAMISLMIYAMIPLRAHMRHAPQATTTAGVQATTAISDAATTPPGPAQPSAGVSTGARATAAQSAANRSEAATASGKAQQPKVKSTGLAMLPETSP